METILSTEVKAPTPEVKNFCAKIQPGENLRGHDTGQMMNCLVQEGILLNFKDEFVKNNPLPS